MAQDGTDFPAFEPEDMIGTVFEGCQVEKLLGSGSYGAVYLVRHLIMNRPFALKVLLPEWLDTPGAEADFFHEGVMAAKLDHPNIVQAVKAGKSDNGLCYFLMEYVPGRSLEEIRQGNPEVLSMEFIINTIIQIADAMAYAWESHRIVHRDIKPGNVLIKENTGIVKVADLGVACIGNGTSAADICVTPMYAPPELVRGEDVIGISGDLYSLGVMFYELCSGAAPFGGNVEEVLHAHLEETPLPLLVVNPDIDPELSRITERLLAKDPGARPQSWGEVRTVFNNALCRLRTVEAGGKKIDHTELAELMQKKSAADAEEQYGSGKAMIIVAVLLLLAGLLAGIWVSL